MSKMFVGNVPFKCNIDDFKNIFKNELGYVSSELIYKKIDDNVDESTRGFGFVQFDANDNLLKALQKKFMLNGRPLRTSIYTNSNKDSESYKLFLKFKDVTNITTNDINLEMTRFGNVTKSYMVSDRKTGQLKGCAIVEFTNKDSMLNALRSKMITIKNVDTQILPFKNKIFRKPYKEINNTPGVDKQYVYRNGVNHGKILGYAEGYLKGYEDGFNDKENGYSKNPNRNYNKFIIMK